MSIITLSIANDCQLQGTRNDWFQWSLSEQLTRIKEVKTIQSLRERQQTAQKSGIDHIVVVESGKSEFFKKLIDEADEEEIQIIFRSQSPSDIVSLACQPETEILEQWKNICKGEPNESQLFQNTALARAYGKSFNHWLSNLHEDDLVDYLPTKAFLPNDFTYAGVENGALVFELKNFRGAWLSLRNRQNSFLSKFLKIFGLAEIKAEYSGAFVKIPKLFLEGERDWNELEAPEWADKWLKNLRVPQKDIKKVGIETPFKDWGKALKKPLVLGPVLAGIAVFAIISVIPWGTIPELDQGYQIAAQKGLSPNREQAFVTDTLGFSGADLPSVSFKAGYEDGVQRLSKNNYKSYSQAAKEFILFWRLGEWVALLEAGCTHQDKLDNEFWKSQQTIAQALIQALQAQKAQTMVETVSNMDKALTEKLSGNKTKTNRSLCGDLKNYSKEIVLRLQ